jgi:hypothetical protein
MVHTVHRGESYPGGPRDDRETTHPTAPYLIDLGYEDIIGALHRLTGPFAAECLR